MRNTKHRAPMYAIYDRTNIQSMLEAQAKQGWMLEKLGSVMWKFKRTEPKDIHFSVTYFPEATFYDPEPSEEQRILQEFCTHGGWVLVDANGPMQVFCSQEADPLPIETDPMVELQNIHKTVKKTYLGNYWLLLAVWALNMGMQISNFVRNPLAYFGSNLSLFNLTAGFSLIAMCLLELVGYYSWHRKAERAAREYGIFIQTWNFKQVERIILWIMLAELALLLVTLRSGSAMLIAMMLAGYLLVAVLGQGLINLMKKLKVSPETNKIYSILIITMLTFFVMACAMTYTFTQEETPEAGVETYDFRGNTFFVYHDSLPLTVEDLMETDYESYSYRLETERSLFLTTQEATQMSRMGDTADGISYDIYDIHIPQVYAVCLQDILNKYEDFFDFDEEGNKIYDFFQSVDAAPWGADAAYCRYSGGAPTNRYLLCYGNRIIEIIFDWSPAEGQMAVVGERLGK